MTHQFANPLSDNRIDYRYKIASYVKYLEDIKLKNLDKLCMTEVVNADISIAMVGEEQYIAGCSEVLATIEQALTALGLTSSVFIYGYTYKNFIVAANDSISNEDFTNLMQNFYAQYELSVASNNELSAVSRFVLVFGQEDMVNRAVSAHFLNRESQVNFFVATDEKERMRTDLQEKVRVIDLVNYSITNDTVIPYYQGIRDNVSGKIEKYEALIRLHDSKGKLRSPASFLSHSKDLKLYPKLSKIMLDKALRQFEDFPADLNLNISLLDIQSEAFRIWFLERIKSHTNPSRVTIEFVETEDYNSNEMLMNFIKELKALGCKIAVDDFGVGFATYTSIISLKPDVIKIDGDIIKNLIKNKENKIILDSICYMARLINSKVVAEYIENEELQNIILESKVDYSQGYYFAKPLPFEELIP